MAKVTSREVMADVVGHATAAWEEMYGRPPEGAYAAIIAAVADAVAQALAARGIVERD